MENWPINKRLKSLYRHLSEEGWHVHANTVAISMEIIDLLESEIKRKDGIIQEYKRESK